MKTINAGLVLSLLWGCSNDKPAEAVTTVAVKPAETKAPAAEAAPAALVAGEVKVGDTVDANYHGKWLRAKIEKIDKKGNFAVNYTADNYKESGVTFKRLRPPAPINAPDPAALAAAKAKPKSGGAASDAPCPGPGLTRRCSGVCVNIQTDDRNCGSCGSQCKSGYHCDGHMSCRDGDGNL